MFERSKSIQVLTFYTTFLVRGVSRFLIHPALAIHPLADYRIFCDSRLYRGMNATRARWEDARQVSQKIIHAFSVEDRVGFSALRAVAT